MTTQQEAINWLNAQAGQYKDFDGMYQAQCVDLFNFYYQFLTGVSPYSKGYGVPGAKDLWNVPTDVFTKIANSNTLVPQPGDVAIYGSSWGGGYGHVEMVLGSDSRGTWFVGNNEAGNPSQPASKVYRTWAQQNTGLIGVMRPNFNQGTTMGATSEQVKQLYRAILWREADQSGLNTYTGKDAYFVANDLYNSVEGNDLRNRFNAMPGQIDNLNKTVGDLTKQLADLKSRVDSQSSQITGLTQTVNEKQAEIAVLHDENTQLKAKLAQAGSDSVQLTALGTLLNWLIVRLGLKKG